MKFNLFKWTHCFVAHVDEEKNVRLMTIPFYIFVLIKLFEDDRKNFHFIPPWKIFPLQ